MLPELHAKLYWSIKLDYRYTPDFSLVVREGVFTPDDPRQPACHPLETVLVNERWSRKTSESQRIADKLGVSVDWVRGFVDAYAGQTPTSNLQDYFEGYLEGQSDELRRLTSIT